MAKSYIKEIGDRNSHGVAATDGARVKTIAPVYYRPEDGAADSAVVPISSTAVYYVEGTTNYAAYSASSTYALNAEVLYSGVAYKCTTAITTAEAWNSSHWTKLPTPTWRGTISGITSLTAGLKIAYKIPIAGGTSSTYLNINGISSNYVYRNVGNTTTHLPAGTVVNLTFDGTYWKWADYDSNSNTEYIIPDAYCSTAASTAAKAATCVGFALDTHKNIPFRIHFTTANSAAGQLTLSLNGTTAKNLYINGSNSSSSNYTIPAGVYMCLYDGAEYIVYTDKTHNGSYLGKNGSFSTPQEAYCRWGGRNLTSSFSPVDAAMVPDLGANRLMFGKGAGVTVEYTRDGGTTWTDYGASENDRSALFSVGATFRLGKSDSTNNEIKVGTDNYLKYKLRVTITTNTFGVYSLLNKFVIYCSTNGSKGPKVTLTARTKANVAAGNDTWSNFGSMTLGGWSGYNVLNVSGITTYGNQNSHYQELRFLFEDTIAPTDTSSEQYLGLSISRIMGFGGVGWTIPSNMARNGHLYTYDASQEATFPARVTAPTFKATSYGSDAILVTNGTANQSLGIKVTRTDTNTGIWMGIGSGGTNHGLYSENINKWIMACNSSGTVSISARYISDANNGIPSVDVATGTTSGCSADFVVPSSGSNIPNSSYNWHIHAILFKNTYFRLTQVAYGSTSSAASIIYERNAWSSDGSTWSWGTWTTFSMSGHKHAAGDITSGTLSVARGGTGLSTATNVNSVVIGNSTTATDAMQTVRTASGAFYATAQDAKPQFGTLPIAQGGTGATTAKGAQYNLLSDMNSSTADIQDGQPFVIKYATPDSNQGTVFTKPASKVWEYIKGKLTSDTGVNISGNAATATTATNANNVKVTTATTTKLYLTGVDGDPGTSGSNKALKTDTGIFATSTAGQLQATSYKVTANATIQYNSTTDAVDLVFA